MPSKYVVIRTDKGKQYEGFLVFKDDDFIILKQKTGGQLVSKKINRRNRNNRTS